MRGFHKRYEGLLRVILVYPVGNHLDYWKRASLEDVALFFSLVLSWEGHLTILLVHV